MKTISIIFISFLFCCCFIDNILSRRPGAVPTDEIIDQQPLDLFFLQDCSGSVKTSVEFVTSQSFEQLFSCNDRDIRIGFLCITSNSAQPPVFLTLTAKSFSAPLYPNVTTLTITERKQAKDAYLAANERYEQDSIRYYSERSDQIALFSAKVDSIVALYRDRFTGETDLATGIAVADKSFNASNNTANRILCINSDGQDSYGRSTTRLRNSAKVFLINADRYATTSIDSIVTNTFTTIAQAINYSLQNNHQ